MKNKKRKIVVDASVAHAAGDTSLYPTSKQCRETLMAIGEYSAVFCPNLKDEWKRHESAFARAWKVKMIQEGRAIFLIQDQVLDEFKQFIEDSQADIYARGAMDKDAHLVSVALTNDKIIVALDEKVRKLFSKHCLNFKGVKKVLWSNPMIDQDGTVSWLKSGAKREKNFTLESFATRLK